MRSILVVTTLFPNAVQPRHGIFVLTRLRHLLRRSDYSATVIAPVPWFPKNWRFVRRYRQYAEIPSEEVIEGITVYHPRFLVIPKVGMLLTPFSLAICILGKVISLHRSGHRFHVLDAHYFYPDGVAVALISRTVRLPFTITGRGTDLNYIATLWLPRLMITWAARSSAACITVSQALANRLVALGVDHGRIHVMRNGVDLQVFQPKDREAARKRFHCTGFTLLCVGHLTDNKGQHLVIKALAALPDAQLIIIGEGETKGLLEKIVSAHGLQERVSFVKYLPQTSLSEAYSAADALVLASESDGLANVLLESLACGTPVVATRIPGTVEVLERGAPAVLVDERTPEAIADAVRRLRAHCFNRDDCRAYAERYGWESTIKSIVRLFDSIRRPIVESAVGHEEQ